MLRQGWKNAFVHSLRNQKLRLCERFFFTFYTSCICRGLVMPRATAWLYAPLPNSSVVQRHMVVVVTAFCQHLLRLIKSAILADNNISVKPKYQPIYRSVSSLQYSYCQDGNKGTNVACVECTTVIFGAWSLLLIYKHEWNGPFFEVELLW